jgi:hypothetical protein
MHEVSADIAELLRLFRRHRVDFLVCGGHAVAFHGYVRLTMDVDILVRPSAANAARVMRALTAFGFGGAGIPEDAFRVPGTAVSLGVQPNQVDLLTSISSQDPDEVFANAVWGRLGRLRVRFVCLPDLLRAKREADRPKDRLDVAELEALHGKQ